jgi:hypothetical protein
VAIPFWSQQPPLGRRSRGVWGVFAVAFVVEAMLLGGGALLFGGRLASVPVRPALGPVKLDLSKLPTPQPAPTAPPAAAPPEAQDTPQDQPPNNPDPPAPEAPEQEPRQSLEESTTPPAYQLPRDDADKMPLPDMSLLPPLDGAHRGPNQPAPPLSNGQADRVSQFYEQLKFRSASGGALSR